MSGVWLANALVYSWMGGMTCVTVAEAFARRGLSGKAYAVISAVAGVLWPGILALGVYERLRR